MPQVTVSRAIVLKAMQSSTTRAALAKKAEAIAGRANLLKAQYDETKDSTIEVSHGTRPKGRPYSRVSCDNGDQEHGTDRVPKIRLLGKAAGLA